METLEFLQSTYKSLKSAILYQIKRLVSTQEDSALDIYETKKVRAICVQVIDDQESIIVQRITLRDKTTQKGWAVWCGVHEPEYEYSLDEDFSVEMLLQILEAVTITIEENK